MPAQKIMHDSWSAKTYSQFLDLRTRPARDLLEQATTVYPNINFIKGDIANFAPAEKIDCLFANASLQWLDAHDVLLPKLSQFINTGGVLAIQMPNNFHAPSHRVTI